MILGLAKNTLTEFSFDKINNDLAQKCKQTMDIYNLIGQKVSISLTGTYLFKVNNENIRTVCEISSKL